MNQTPKSQSDWDRLRDGSLDEAGQRRLQRERPATPDPGDLERLRAALQAEARAGWPAEEPGYETVAAYVDGALDDVGRELFEARLQDDPQLHALVAICADELDARPNLDFALLIVAERLGLPTGAGTTMFALGRLVGWIAHVFEAWAAGTLIRPRARYVGPRPDLQSSQ